MLVTFTIKELALSNKKVDIVLHREHAQSLIKKYKTDREDVDRRHVCPSG